MKIRNLNVVVYDIEVFSNCFHCTCKDTESGDLKFFEISQRKNQISDLVSYFTDKALMFCGYNNKHYDDVVINYIINLHNIMLKKNVTDVCKSIYNLSQCIINSENENTNEFKKWKYLSYFPSLDLLTMQFSSKLRVGLKEMQLTMHYKNVQEYSGSFDKELPICDFEEMIAYNINDVDSTTELLNRLQKDIELRLFIEDEYKIPCLSYDSVKIGETLLAKFYCDSTNIYMK